MHSSWKILGVVTCSVCLFLSASCSGERAPQPRELLEPLESMTLRCREIFDLGKYEPTGLAMRVHGVDINRDVYSFEIEKKPAYDDPLSCCVAVCRAVLEVDEEWYGALGAPPEVRDQQGVPRDYVPDSGENLFKACTWHTYNENFAKPVANKVTRLLRVGGMYAFQIDITNVWKGERRRNPGSIIIRRFGNGLYRLAWEWMRPEQTLFGVLADAIPESPEQAAYRTKDPELHHEVRVAVPYGDIDGDFPLVLLFRGGCVNDAAKFQRLRARENRIAELGNLLFNMENKETYMESPQRKEMARLLSADSMKKIDELAPSGARIGNPNILFFVDGQEVCCGLVPGRNETLARALRMYRKGKSGYVLSEVYTETILERFIAEDWVWGPLSEEIRKHIENCQ